MPEFLEQRYSSSVRFYLAAISIVGYANARGALAALLTGLVLGLGRLVGEVGEVAVPAGLEWFGAMSFLHFAIVLFVVCSATLVLVRVWTRPPDAARVAPLTVQHGRGDAIPDPSRTTDVALSVGLVALVVAAWLYFS